MKTINIQQFLDEDDRKQVSFWQKCFENNDPLIATLKLNFGDHAHAVKADELIQSIYKLFAQDIKYVPSTDSVSSNILQKIKDEILETFSNDEYLCDRQDQFLTESKVRNDYLRRIHYLSVLDKIPDNEIFDQSHHPEMAQDIQALAQLSIVSQISDSNENANESFQANAYQILQEIDKYSDLLTCNELGMSDFFKQIKYNQCKLIESNLDCHDLGLGISCYKLSKALYDNYDLFELEMINSMLAGLNDDESYKHECLQTINRLLCGDIEQNVVYYGKSSELAYIWALSVHRQQDIELSYNLKWSLDNQGYLSTVNEYKASLSQALNQYIKHKLVNELNLENETAAYINHMLEQENDLTLTEEIAYQLIRIDKLAHRLYRLQDESISMLGSSTPSSLNNDEQSSLSEDEQTNLNDESYKNKCYKAINHVLCENIEQGILCYGKSFRLARVWALSIFRQQDIEFSYNLKWSLDNRGYLPTVNEYQALLSQALNQYIKDELINGFSLGEIPIAWNSSLDSMERIKGVDLHDATNIHYVLEQESNLTLIDTILNKLLESDQINEQNLRLLCCQQIKQYANKQMQYSANDLALMQRDYVKRLIEIIDDLDDYYLAYDLYRDLQAITKNTDQPVECLESSGRRLDKLTLDEWQRSVLDNTRQVLAKLIHRLEKQQDNSKSQVFCDQISKAMATAIIETNDLTIIKQMLQAFKQSQALSKSDNNTLQQAIERYITNLLKRTPSLNQESIDYFIHFKSEFNDLEFSKNLLRQLYGETNNIDYAQYYNFFNQALCDAIEQTLFIKTHDAEIAKDCASKVAKQANLNYSRDIYNKLWSRHTSYKTVQKAIQYRDNIYEYAKDNDVSSQKAYEFAQQIYEYNDTSFAKRISKELAEMKNKSRRPLNWLDNYYKELSTLQAKRVRRVLRNCNIDAHKVDDFVIRLKGQELKNIDLELDQGALKKQDPNELSSELIQRLQYSDIYQDVFGYIYPSERHDDTQAASESVPVSSHISDEDPHIINLQPFLDDYDNHKGSWKRSFSKRSIFLDTLCQQFPERLTAIPVKELIETIYNLFSKEGGRYIPEQHKLSNAILQKIKQTIFHKYNDDYYLSERYDQFLIDEDFKDDYLRRITYLNIVHSISRESGFDSIDLAPLEKLSQLQQSKWDDLRVFKQIKRKSSQILTKIEAELQSSDDKMAQLQALITSINDEQCEEVKDYLITGGYYVQQADIAAEVIKAQHDIFLMTCIVSQLALVSDNNHYLNDCTRQINQVVSSDIQRRLQTLLHDEASEWALAICKQDDLRSTLRFYDTLSEQGYFKALEQSCTFINQAISSRIAHYMVDKLNVPKGEATFFADILNQQNCLMLTEAVMQEVLRFKDADNESGAIFAECSGHLLRHFDRQIRHWMQQVNINQERAHQFADMVWEVQSYHLSSQLYNKMLSAQSKHESQQETNWMRGVLEDCYNCLLQAVCDRFKRHLQKQDQLKDNAESLMRMVFNKGDLIWAFYLEKILRDWNLEQLMPADYDIANFVIEQQLESQLQMSDQQIQSFLDILNNKVCNTFHYSQRIISELLLAGERNSNDDSKFRCFELLNEGVCSSIVSELRQKPLPRMGKTPADYGNDIWNLGDLEYSIKLLDQLHNNKCQVSDVTDEIQERLELTRLLSSKNIEKRVARRFAKEVSEHNNKELTRGVITQLKYEYNFATLPSLCEDIYNDLYNEKCTRIRDNLINYNIKTDKIDQFIEELQQKEDITKIRHIEEDIAQGALEQSLTKRITPELKWFLEQPGLYNSVADNPNGFHVGSPDDDPTHLRASAGVYAKSP